MTEIRYEIRAVVPEYRDQLHVLAKFLASNFLVVEGTGTRTRPRRCEQPRVKAQARSHDAFTTFDARFNRRPRYDKTSGVGAKHSPER